MKKILVPIDFSKASRAAALYAGGIAQAMNASITLLHVINTQPSEQSLSTWRKIEQRMLRASRKDGLDLIAEIDNELGNKIAIDFEVIQGHPVEERIEDFVKANGIDLIIMGTRGASGLKKVLMGSNAVAVINDSSVPVITVPEEAKFSAIKTIVYASDNAKLKYEIRKVALFARLFHAQLHVLHVGSPGAAPANIADLERELIDIAHFSDIQVHISGGENISAILDAFIAQQKADLLVMFTEKMNYFKQVFGNSMTREFAFSGKIPMLTLNKTAAEFAVMQGWEFDLNFK